MPKTTFQQTALQTQITFKASAVLKERALYKARQEGFTLKALLSMAMREYVNDNLLFSLRSKEDYHDKIFADKEVVARANELGALMKKDKIFGENLSLNNKKAKALILKMLDLVMDDIKHGRYQKENTA